MTIELSGEDMHDGRHSDYFNREARAIFATMPDLAELADTLHPWETTPAGDPIPWLGNDYIDPDRMHPSREVRRYGNGLFDRFLIDHGYKEPA
jgi:hypothetical protein